MVKVMYSWGGSTSDNAKDNEYGNDISIIHMEMIFPYEMWEWDSNITYGNVIPILYMGMSFQLQIPISYMGILFPHEIGEWPTIINFAV